MLGVRWDVKDDLFRFEVPSLTVGVEVATQRQALGAVMKFNFDPLGIISINALLGKMCLQKFFKNQRGWDERMPRDALRIFESWRRKIPLLKQLTVQRWIGLGNR